MRTILIFAATAVLFILFSCNNQFLSEPQFPSGGGAAERGILAPEGIKASQGERRNITLSWDQRPNAARYYIYSAETPLNTFVRCGETSSTQFVFTVPPGKTAYYRISSVARDGTESAQSLYVRGTSLAQPVISDITDITESAASVTWYMENVFDDHDSYKDKLLYTVYCYNGSVEVAQIALDASVISENRAVFTGLAPNTRYEYQVEAYLRGDQNAGEKSDKMDAATARRFRPGAPVDLRASRGTAKDTITLSFELPDMVDIALGDNLYDPKPIYFVISKRYYSESGNNEYQLACSYFGSIAGKGELFPNGAGYIPGAIVIWSDTKASRGVKYEYLVQSYVDDTLKVISSDASKSSAVGWALSEGSLSFGAVEYTMGTSLYASATLPLDFEFDPQNISYGYKLIETIAPLEDGDPNDLSGPPIERETAFDSYDAVRAYIPTMDLTRKTTQDNPGRGLYSYAIEIRLNDDTPPLYTVSTVGKVEVSENTDPIIVKNFRVQDGYTNKFVLKWDNYSNRKYTLYIVDSKGTIVGDPVNGIGSVNETPNDLPTANLSPNTNYSYDYTADDIKPGVTLYFAIRPSRRIDGGSFKQGQMVYAAAASRTLGVPEAELGGASTYSAITAAWSDAQKADTYRVKFRYAGETAYKIAAEIKKEALSVDAFNKYKYTFKPEGNEIAVANAGKEIEIEVDALNKGLQEAVGGGEIFTTSNEYVSTRLVGPALLGLSASKAASPQEITVKWNKISGAGGYYVFRRQFNMNNTAEDGTEAVVYYVPAVENSTVTVTGKELLLKEPNNPNSEKIDTATVTASVTFAGGRYTLIDRYMTDGEYDVSFNSYTPFYRNQQNDMIQGCSYRYYVVPVINDSTAFRSIEFVCNKDNSSPPKNTNINYYTIPENGEVKYLGAASLEQEGFTIGFGQDVTATKGTYKSSGDINNGIKIIWKAPPRLSSVSGFTPKYTVYRRESGGSAWEQLKLDVNATEYIETQLIGTRGSAYEYVIGISGSGSISDPRTNKRFIDKCYKQLDEKGRPKMLGFMLDQVKMESVSRNEQKVGNDFAEEVKWKAAGIKHRDGVGNKWGIDGYEVWVMNRNIDADWHLIADIPAANIPDEIDQSVKVTNVAGGNTLESGLLKVMRDYKHFFKVRSYVLDGDDKVYCPDPTWKYETKYDADRSLRQNSNATTRDNHLKDQNKMQDDYVKWGARQISTTEFAQIGTLHVAWGIHQIMRGRWSWTSTLTRTSKTVNGNNGSSGTVYCQSSAGVGKWWWWLDNYRPDMDTKANKNTGNTTDDFAFTNTGWSHQYSVTFLRLHTGTSSTARTLIYGDTPASSNYPTWYGADGTYGADAFDIYGPDDVPGMYRGKMRFVSFYLGSGSIRVNYPETAAEVQVTNGYSNCPLPFNEFQTSTPFRMNQDAWY